MPISNQCVLCKHYQLFLQCDAFPDRIPEQILTGEADHTVPYPGDHGIRFEPATAPKGPAQ